MATRSLPMIALALGVAVAWYLGGTHIAYRLGAGDASAALGAAAAFGTALFVWRGALADDAERARRIGACPRCGESLTRTHEHAAAGALAAGMLLLECASCGYRHTSPLTCEACRT